MFPQFKKLNDESGVVLFIVLMVAIIIMLFAVGILTQSLNETNYSQQQIDQIVSEELAKGMFWNAYSSGNLQDSSFSNVISNRNYTVTLTNSGTAGGITTFSVASNYDTFQ